MSGTHHVLLCTFYYHFRTRTCHRKQNNRFATIKRLVLLTSMLAIVSGCAAKQKVEVEGNYDDTTIKYAEGIMSDVSINNAMKNHIIEISSSGEHRTVSYSLIKLEKGNGTFKHQHAEKNYPLEIQPNLTDLVKNIHQEWSKCSINNAPPEEVVFIIHGGMVPLSTGIEESITLLHAMKADFQHKGQPGCYKRYPIFINWRSGGPGAYWEQLTKIRKGERKPKLAAASAPIKVVSDIGRGLFDMPSFAFLEGARLWQTQSQSYNDCAAGVDNLTCPNPPPSRPLREISEYTQYFLKTPFRIATAPFIHGMGKSAWENMLRRTRQTIVQEPEKDKEIIDGVLAKLMKTLFKKNPDDRSSLPCDRDIKVSFLAHSMGTIIASDLMNKFQNCSYNQVLFMAAAVSIREFSEKVIPVLSKQKDMKFYNHSLYPKLEAREMSAFGLVPSGSLLEWIDEMFTPPTTKFDRTLGNWTNVREVYQYFQKTFPEDVNNRIFFRVFGRGLGEPQKHGEFNDIDKCFWQDDYLSSGATKTSWEIHYRQCRSMLKCKGLLPDGIYADDLPDQQCENVH
jgi:hypothetical protein